MAFQDMWTELRGTVPRLPIPFAKTLINRAWGDLRRASLWSFQLFESQWIAPGQLTGTVTTTQGVNTVVVSAPFAAAIDALTATYSLITQRQFRLSSGPLYSIIGWDSATQTLTLDRLYGEGSSTGSVAAIYQAYYAVTDNSGAPLFDFREFISVRDMQNYIDLRLTMTRDDLDSIDPQRTWYAIPSDVIPYKTDPVTTSATYRCMLYELWGAPTYTINYQILGIRKGLDLVQPLDQLPPQVGEDVIISRAKVYAYEWAEANKDQLAARDAGTDFRFLMGASQKEYLGLMRDYRKVDRDLVDSFFQHAPRSGLYGRTFPYYNSRGGTAYPGR